MRKHILPVSGMHCKSCELLLEKSIKKVPDVAKVSASQAKSAVDISFEGAEPDWKAVESVVKECGYSVGKTEKLPWLQKDPEEYESLVVSVVGLGGLWYMLKYFGIDLTNVGNVSTPTLSIAFLVGVTAGLSSCMALVGGLVLGISAKWNQARQSASGWTRFEPHLYFNLGRVLGFGVFGGLLGAFGSFIGFSPSFVGAATLAAWALMILLGFNLTNLSPRLGSINVTLPKFLGKGVGAGSEGKSGAMLTGALTFFLPCGFTLAMQAYAVSTGSFVTGALTMAFFALGTAPGLLGVGSLTSFLKGNVAKRFFKFTGVIVVALGVFNLSNGYTLVSLGTGPSKSENPAVITGTQEVRMTEDDFGYSPKIIKIRPNTRIRLIVDAKSVYSCASHLIIPSVGVSKRLSLGENVIEFDSPASGEVKFSCSMGMYTGKFVVEDEVRTPEAYTEASAQTPADTAAPVFSDGEAETVNLTYDSDGLSNRNLVLEKGKNYVIRISVKETVRGCMHTILIPELDENIQGLTAGSTVTFRVKAEKAGTYPIVCAMNVPHDANIVIR